VRQIDRIVAAGTQLFTLTTDDGIDLNCTLYFMPSQNLWNMDIVSDNFTVFGMNILNNINMLRQYERVLTFGILIRSDDDVDPYRVDDFETKRSEFYLLNQVDLDDIEVLLFDEV
jgi:hypothetical protein